MAYPPRVGTAGASGYRTTESNNPQQGPSAEGAATGSYSGSTVRNAQEVAWGYIPPGNLGQPSAGFVAGAPQYDQQKIENFVQSSEHSRKIIPDEDTPPDDDSRPHFGASATRMFSQPVTVTTVPPPCSVQTQPIRPPSDVLFDSSEACMKQKISDQHLAPIARAITNWRNLTPCLGLSARDEEDISEAHPHSVALQKIAMLREWNKKTGSRATYGALAQAFLEAEHRQLAEFVVAYARTRVFGQSPDDENSDDESSTETWPDYSIKWPARSSKYYLAEHLRSRSAASRPRLPAIQVLDSHLLEIGRELTNWLELGYSLFKPATAEGLENRASRWTTKEAGYQMLLNWKRLGGFGATYPVLYEKLVEVGRQNLADKLAKLAAAEVARQAASDAEFDLD